MSEKQLKLVTIVIGAVGLTANIALVYAVVHFVVKFW